MKQANIVKEESETTKKKIVINLIKYLKSSSCMHMIFFPFFNCNIDGDHLVIPTSTSNKIELKLNLHLGMG